MSKRLASLTVVDEDAVEASASRHAVPQPGTQTDEKDMKRMGLPQELNVRIVSCEIEVP